MYLRSGSRLVSESSVKRYVYLDRQSGSVEASTARRGPLPKINEEGLAAIKAMLEVQCDLKQPAACRLVFIDEAGSHISMTRRYGRAPKGKRAEDTVPRNRGTVTTMVGALTVEGLVAMACFEGGTDGDRFVAFLEQVLAPELVPGDLVVSSG